MLLIESYVHIILGWGVAIIMTLIILGCFLPLLPQLKELSINMPILRILGVSFIFSLLIPLFGCLIPLFRVARLKPTEAFKYE